MASPVPEKGSNQTSSKLRLQMELFSEAKAHWGAPHRQVFCQHDKDTVVLYRACCEHLGPHATDTQCFRGSPCYEKDRARMMWFDTSFLVSMRKSEWGTKKGREVVLAIWVKRSFIEDCLGTAVCSNTFGASCGNAKCNNGEGSGGSGDNGRRSRFSVSSLSAGRGRGNRSRSPGSACSSPAGSSAGSPPQSPIFSPQNHKQQPGDAYALGGGGRGAKSGGSGSGDGGDRATAAATAAAGLLARGRHALGREDSDFVGAGDVEEVRARALTGGARMQSDFGEGGRSSAAAGGVAGEGGDGGGLGRTASEGGTLVGGGTAERRTRSQSWTWSPYSRRMTEGVRVHWEPERLPSGEKHRTRRVVQLGLKGKWLQNLGSGDAVVRIERLDPVLAAQRAALNSSKPHLLTVPVARPLDVGHLADNQLAALHLVSERARPKLRILCLHGYLQNSQIFSRRTRQLCKKLKNTAELVYVDAPHLLSPEELPPPLPAAVSPLEEAAIAAAAAAAAAAAKVVDAGEGGAFDAEWVSPLPSPVTSPVFGRKTMEDGSSRGGRAGSDAGSPTKQQQQQQQQQQQDRVGARTWWRCDAEERKRAKAVPGMAGRCEWKGLEESLAFLTKVWDEQGPFDGLLGFSQGAAMASIFNHCVFSGGGSANACRGNCGPDSDIGGGTELLGDVHARDMEVFERPLLPPPKFGVFISGCYQPHPTQIPSYPLTQEQPQAKLPSLHVWAIEDRFVPASQSQRLAGMYLRSAVFMHRGSHCVPQNKDIVPNFVRFLEEYR